MSATLDIPRGRIFAFDGIDGCGKSTLSWLVYQENYLRTNKGIHTAMPGGTPLGQELRKLLKDKQFKPHMMTERLMFAADYNEHAQQINEWVNAGEDVICDRWSRFTDRMYGQAAGVSLSQFDHLHALVPDIKPDILFIVEVPQDVAKQRRESRTSKVLFGTPSPEKDCRIEGNGDEFMERVRHNYQIASQNVPPHNRTNPLQGYAYECAHQVVVLYGINKPAELAQLAGEIIQGKTPPWNNQEM